MTTVSTSTAPVPSSEIIKKTPVDNHPSTLVMPASVEESTPALPQVQGAVLPNNTPQSFFPNAEAQKAKLCVSDNDDENENLCCPITGEVMQNPVVTKAGISYEREAIIAWINKDGKDPSTREPMTVADLRPNLALKAIIEQRQAANNSKSPTV